jgi:hypothetical protein
MTTYKIVPSTYRIVRCYLDGKCRVIRRGLTFEQAKAHCRNPETSSRTATSTAARRRTKARGPWFDGYEDDSDGA